MVNKRFFGPARHEHADPARRAIAASELPPDSEELAALLATDPAPEVRVAAANRCADVGALAAAWQHEADPDVRVALASALGTVLAATHDSVKASALLDADPCTDAIRVEVARRALEMERRRRAIAAIRDEGSLIELALTAEHAETRIAAAVRVRTREALRKLLDSAKNKDKGVARVAR